MECNFESMSLEHIPAVLEIEQASFPTPWSQQAFSYELQCNNLACYVVALHNGKVIGYGGLWLVLDEAHVTNIAIHPAYRGKRLGEKLLFELIRRTLLAGATKMTLEVRPSNYVARKLYTKMGFVERGLRKKYYSDNNEDAIVMWLDALPEPAKE